MSHSERRQKAEQHWREIHAHQPELLRLALAWVAAEYAATEIGRVYQPTTPVCKEAQARANEAYRQYLRAKHGASSVFMLLG